jgi:putative aldouronate transport system permease protein
MKIKKSKAEKTFEAFNVLLLTAIMMITVYPFLYVFFASLSDADLLMAHSGVLLSPLGLNFSAYKGVISNPMILQGYKNTLLILFFGVMVNLLLTSFGAYFLSRKNVLWQKAIMKLIIFTMFFNGGLIPTYINIRELGLYNNLLALILPCAISTFNLIIMKTYMDGIPIAFEEQATIDGANDFIILFRIIIPIAMPSVAVMILYYGVFHWNSWFSAMIYISDRSLLPLQVILREILIQNDTAQMASYSSELGKNNISETIKYATIIITTLPVLFVYPFLQKYFVKGVMIGGVKG